MYDHRSSVRLESQQERLDPGSSDVQVSVMASIRERLEEVIRDQLVPNATAWSKAAGLDKGHVATLLRRLSNLEAGDEERVETLTLEALASAAKVRAGWLAFGEPPRHAERFPNRSTALAFARARNADEAALREIETAPEWQKTDYVTRGVAWWGDEILAAEARHAHQRGQALIRDALPSSQPPAPVSTLKKRRA